MEFNNFTSKIEIFIGGPYNIYLRETSICSKKNVAQSHIVNSDSPEECKFAA